MSNAEVLKTEEQQAIEQFILRTLRDLSRPNAVRLRAGITILMTASLNDFEKITSKSVQSEVFDLKNLLVHPETYAPKTCEQNEERKKLLNHIKSYTLDHLNLLDERITILPNAASVKKTLLEGERLKSVIHASALRNVVTAAYFSESVEKEFKQKGLTGSILHEKVKAATESMAKLHTAVIDDDLQTFQQALLVEGIDVNLPNPDGLPLLHLAVRDNRPKMVELLLKVPDINVNLVSNNGWTPLHFAARLEYVDIISLLLTSPNINVNAVNSDGWTPLHWASWQGDTASVTVLLRSKAIEVNKRDSSQGTPLHWAARNGQADVIAMLLSHPNILVNLVDIDGRTALHYAVSFDHVAATSALLLSPKLDVNIEDVDGLTPLHWAARNGRVELVDLLMGSPNIRFNIRDHNGMTPADWARRNQNLVLISRLKVKEKPWTIRIRDLIWDIVSRFKQAWNRE